MIFCSSEVMVCGMPDCWAESCRPVKVRMKNITNELFILIDELSGWNAEGDVKIRDLVHFYHTSYSGGLRIRNLQNVISGR